MGPLILAGAVLLAAMGAAAALDSPTARYPWLLALLVPATCAWWLAARRALGAGAAEAGATWLAFAVAALLRVLWLLPEVPLSDDLYRYLWDGRVANAGVHPFAFPPSAPELAHLRDDEIWPRVNHPDVPTIYPPVAQLAFRALDAVLPTALGARVLSAVLDLATMAALAALLRTRGRPAPGALVVGWCPLSVMESAGGGHVDGLGVSLLIGGLFALSADSRARAAGGGLLLALSAMVKPVALVLAPAVLARSRAARRPAFLLGCALAALLALPYLGAGAKLFAGLSAYGERWRFNDAVYSLLVATGLAPLGARAVLALAVLTAALLVPRGVRDPLAAAGSVVFAGIALSPTVHPWYAQWIVPLLPFLPRAVSPAAYALVALLPVSYAAAWLRDTTGVWGEPAWSRPALWIPVLALLVVGLAVRRSART
ncbi:MAG: glycosyltransferase 87 family protein [Candidatus Eiseniibacteriota bacterium]